MQISTKLFGQELQGQLKGEVGKLQLLILRLWSSISDTNVTDAQIRITDHICRMNRRGIMAEPIDPGFCL